jgi:leucyl aminopeptidase
MNIPKVELVSLKSELLAEEALIFLVFEGEKNIAKELSRVFSKTDVAKMVAYVTKRKFEGKLKQVVHVPFGDDTVVVLVGLGLEKNLDLDQFRKAANAGLSVLKQLQIQTAAYIPAKTSKATPQQVITAVTEGAVLGTYEFDRYKSKPKDTYELKGIRVVFDSVTKALEAQLEKTLIICEGVYFTRDLENENSDKVTPETFAKEVQKVAKELKLTCKVLEEPELKKQNMNLLRAVGQGSKVPPRLIVLEYNGSGKKTVDIALAGKGITFDTGGINLKPDGWLHQMHIDMAGAATVLSTIALASRLKLKKHIVGVMALAENAIGSGSYKPGSIFVSHSGKSVEIVNTDAEGRLVLGDALSYVVKNYKPREVVDVATLTGAVLISLGSQAAGIFGNDPKMIQKFIAAGAITHERLWELPLYEEFFDEDVKGTFGDIKNLGSKMRGNYAGSSVAALFLKEFVGDTKWVHLDVAGTAILDAPMDYMPKNGTGFGVRLLLEYLA